MCTPSPQWIERVLGIIIRAGINILFFIVLYGSWISAFVHLESAITNNTFNPNDYWPQVLIPLAILIAFSGLMYNRARAVGDNAHKHRFRSLYAAERLMAASCFYLAALVCAFFAVATADFFVLIFKVSPPNIVKVRFTLFGPAIVFVGWTMYEVSDTIRAIAPNGAYRRKIRVAKRIRSMM